MPILLIRLFVDFRDAVGLLIGGFQRHTGSSVYKLENRQVAHRSFAIEERRCGMTASISGKSRSRRRFPFETSDQTPQSSALSQRGVSREWFDSYSKSRRGTYHTSSCISVNEYPKPQSPTVGVVRIIVPTYRDGRIQFTTRKGAYFVRC